MADTASATVRGAISTVGVADPTKRDLLNLVTGSAGVSGRGALVWPFIDSMNPAKDVLALSSIEVDLSPIQEGQAITAVWRGKPIFLRNRTADEIKSAENVPLNQLIDPQSDADRVKPGKEKWLVVIGICTHLGCVPLGNKVTDPRGDWGGWFCPCHGSQYDTSGRVRHGPAPANLGLPPYAIIRETNIKMG